MIAGQHPAEAFFSRSFHQVDGINRFMGNGKVVPFPDLACGQDVHLVNLVLAGIIILSIVRSEQVIHLL
jgi:hypothetical protein